MIKKIKLLAFIFCLPFIPLFATANDGDFSILTGFQGWYILQHLNECETGCEAFVDHAKHEEWVEIKIE